MASDFVKAPDEIHCSLREFAWRVGFPCKNSRPQTLHLLVRDQPAFVKEICNPIVLHVVRFVLRSNIGKCFERYRHDIDLLLLLSAKYPGISPGVAVWNSQPAATLEIFSAR